MLSVMIVEDNVDFRKILCKALTRVMPDLFVFEAVDGRQAVRLAAEMRPDLTLIDVGLPLMSGLEVTRILKNRGHLPCVVVITGNDLPEYVEAARQAGADYFLSKNSAKLDEITSLVRDFFSAPETLQAAWGKYRL